MEEIQDKAAYAEKLAHRAEAGLLAVKILFIAVAVTVLGLIIFAIAAAAAEMSTKARLIGLIIFLCLTVLLFAGVVASFVYSKINLDRLKKLK